MTCFLEYRIREAKTPEDRRVLFDALEADLSALQLRLRSGNGIGQHELAKCLTSVVGLFAAVGRDDLVSIARALRALAQAEVDSPDRWAIELLELLDLAPQCLAERWPEDYILPEHALH